MFRVHITLAIIISRALVLASALTQAPQGWPDMTYLIQMSMRFAGHLRPCFLDHRSWPGWRAFAHRARQQALAFIPIMIRLVAGQGRWSEALPACSAVV